MAETETFDELPPGYDARLDAVLREPVPDDVIVRFYYMAAAKNPAVNYRWDLRRDGRLFLARHSGNNPSYEITFDQSLSDKPVMTLRDNQIDALNDQFKRSAFFQQPRLQRLANAQDGFYVVVRARRGDHLHDVVYHNVDNPPVKYLHSITADVLDNENY